MAVLARTFDAATVLRRARGGPWRAEVAEESMAPALRPGDWLVLDPTCRRWPRPGTIVVVREPGSGTLVIKRVAARGATGQPRPVGGSVPAEGARPPSRVTLADGTPHVLGPREGWVLGDAPDVSVDSRRYGPLDADDLVARAWFRYGPLRRIGRLR
jgi:signal peptidase I